MLNELEEQIYESIDLLKKEETKYTITHASKFLSQIAIAITENHLKLKQSLAINAPSPVGYLALYNLIMEGNRLFELRDALKEALRVKERSEERIAGVKPSRPKFYLGKRRAKRCV